MRALPEQAGDHKFYQGTGSINGKKKIAVEFEGKIVPFGELEDIDEQRKFFDLLTRK